MSFLVQHALNNVWAEPVQDRQEWIEATRLTDVYGGVGGFTLYQRYIRFPVVAGVRYFHFYHLGTFPVELLGIENIGQAWSRLSEVIVDSAVLIQAILRSGVTIPISRCWIKVALDRGIYLAIEIRSSDQFGTIRRVDEFSGEIGFAARRISDEALYLRFYSNAIVANATWRAERTNVDQPYFVYEKRIDEVADLQVFTVNVAQIQSSYNGYGLGYYTKGGFHVDAPGAFAEEMAGFVWTYAHDLTMELLVEKPMTELGVFDSDVDSQVAKYLVWESDNYDRIDYHDDIDFVLFYAPAGKGVMIPRYAKKTVRQITHNSYSIPVNVIQYLRTLHGFLDIEQVTIRLYIRRGGMTNSLVYQGDRLSDLFRLPTAVAKAMLVGSESNVPFWKASYLEGSSYNRVVSGKVEEIDSSLVENAYGYHAINKVAYMPYQDLSGQTGTRLVQLSPANATSSVQTLYSYDVDGHFLGSSTIVLNGAQINDRVFEAPDQNAYAIELLIGEEVDPSTDPQRFYTGDSFTIPGLRDLNFRVYLQMPDDDRIVDVTGQNVYSITGDTFQWGMDAVNNAVYKMVRFSDQILSMTKTFDQASYLGVIEITAFEYPIDGFQSPSPFGYGNLDVFLDQELLVENIDYYVNWPRIVVVRKPSTLPDDTVLRVRAYGFPDKDTLLHRGARDYGFVRGGVLSVNDVFDLRDDRNIRLVIDGKILNPEDKAYAEELLGTQVLDGRPYAITEYRQDVDQFCVNDTLSLREIADQRDGIVSSVLERFLPMRSPNTGFVVGNRWEVVSPVVSRLIHAFVQEGYLALGEGLAPFDNTDVANWISPYDDLFAFDPCVRGANPYYVNILAHQYNNPLPITEGQRNILAYVIRHYLRDLVDISGAVTIMN